MSDSVPELDPDAPAFVHWSPRRGATVGEPVHPPSSPFNAGVALGVLMTAAGAVAVGALAIGALAVGRLVVGQARIADLKVDRLEVGELVVLRRR